MLNKSYWTCVLVAFILSLIGGAYTGSGMKVWTNAINRIQTHQNMNNYKRQYYNNYNIPYGKNGNNQIAMSAVGEKEPVALSSSSDMAVIMGILSVFLGVYLIILVVVMAIGLLVRIFVFNPLKVGGYHYFLNNSRDVGRFRSLGMVFGSGYYLNVVKVMFLRDLFHYLWSLLFIIPGVIKAYEYSMIPYLLAYDPSMESSEVFAKTKEMTNGEKWDIFLLKWSFFGWDFLNVFTLNLLKLLFLEPYKQATYAELFLALGGKDFQYMQGTHGTTYYTYQQSATQTEYKQI